MDSLYKNETFKKLSEIPTLEKFTGYSISTSGILWSSKTNKRLSTTIRKGNGCEYEVIGLPDSSGIKRKFSIHRLVALAFKFNENHEQLTVNHIDENTLNNDVSNLEWMTVGDNIRYSQAGKCYAGDPNELTIEFNNSEMTLVDFAKSKNVPMNTMWGIVNKISNIENAKKRRVFSEDLKKEIIIFLTNHSGKEASVKFNCSQSMVSKIKKEHLSISY